MSKIKILVAFGTRPEIIKMAPVIFELQKNSQFFQIALCNTGQHKEMADRALSLFGIQVDYNLEVMLPGQTLSLLSSRILTSFSQVLESYRPNLILVHGDTSTALFASLAAFYNSIDICHVEAGLRTYNILSPYPEEFNRKSIASIAKFHFAPTHFAQENLLNEGIDKSNILVTGNTVIDTLTWALRKLESTPNLSISIVEQLQSLLRFHWHTTPFVLVTGHRRENFGDGFRNICIALRTLALRFPSFHFVYPVHLNPNVQVPVYRELGELQNIHLIPPLEYFPFLMLLRSCYFVLTDSGGIQEEAPSLGKPVLVMRDTTERPEAISAGTAKLVGTDFESIVASSTMLLNGDPLYAEMANSINPYGDGCASPRIVEFLLKAYV